MTNPDHKERVLEFARWQAIGWAEAREIAQALHAENGPSRDSEEYVHASVAFAKAMVASGRITSSEFLMYATYAVESLHTKRWLAGEYDDLKAISAAISEIEAEYGLREGEYWLKDDEPPKVRALNEKYEAALDQKFERMLEDFGLDEWAKLWRENRAEYDRQREVGRRSIFEKHDHVTAVTSMLDVYEKEAGRSAESEAYYAAVVMLGSAAETRLLAAVLAHPAEAEAALNRLGGADKPRNRDPLHWSLEHLVLVAEAAGWIGPLENDEVGVNLGLWLLSVRNTRNLLHPGRHARDKPHAIIGAEEYTALCISLTNSLPKTKSGAD